MNNFETFSSLFLEKYQEQGVMLTELKQNNYSLKSFQSFPPISALVLHIMVLKGSMQITIDNVQHHCTKEKNNLITIKPINRISDIQITSDFLGHVIALSKHFMDNATPKVKPIAFSDVILTRLYHTFTLSKANIEILSNHFHLLLKNCGGGNSTLDKYIFQCVALLYHLKILKVSFTEIQNKQTQRDISRAAMLCNQFFELLAQHVEQEHEVAFYANQLNITSHYLSKITYQYIGSSANKIIANELITIASILLRNPQYTLQQIADRLHFCDQSSFGKFFKKHTGKTPITYRRESCLPLE